MLQTRFLLSLVVLVFVNAASIASISVVPTQPAVLPGFTAYGIFWDGGGTQDWTSAAINIELTSGTFYQHPLGGDGPPSTGLISIIPEIEFDTYFGVIDDVSINVACTAGDTGGGCFGIISDTNISGSWFNSATDNTGLVKIGNFTVSNDALGTWSLLSAGVQISGIIIPEPASVALFGVTCPLLLRRCRKRFEHPA